MLVSFVPYIHHPQDQLTVQERSVQEGQDIGLVVLAGPDNMERHVVELVVLAGREPADWQHKESQCRRQLVVDSLKEQSLGRLEAIRTEHLEHICSTSLRMRFDCRMRFDYSSAAFVACIVVALVPRLRIAVAAAVVVVVAVAAVASCRSSYHKTH